MCVCVMEYYSAIKKEWNFAICNNTDESRGYDAKQNKPVDKDKYHFDFIHMWSLRNKTNE